MPLPYDPSAPRKKYLLVHAIRAWNAKHPDRHVSYVEGFRPETDVIGDPARDTLRAYSREAWGDPIGVFNPPTLKRLILEKNPQAGIRADVMAVAHSQLGKHEWPPESNAGEIVKYLKACGIGEGNPWCAAFVTWVLKKSGFRGFPPNPAYVPSWHEWAKRRKLLIDVDDSKLGDLWIWWNNQHIGFCDDTDPDDFIAYGLDGNVGAYGGSVTQVKRTSPEVTSAISLTKLVVEL